MTRQIMNPMHMCIALVIAILVAVPLHGRADDGAVAPAETAPPAAVISSPVVLPAASQDDAPPAAAEAMPKEVAVDPPVAQPDAPKPPAAAVASVVVIEGGASTPDKAPEEPAGAAVSDGEQPEEVAQAEEGDEAVPEESVPDEVEVPRVTLNFSTGADIRDVLTAYSVQSGRSVVLGPEVSGEVRLHLNNVPWDEALDVILQPYGYSHKRVGDTIIVSRMAQQAMVESVEPLVSRVFTLRYLDAFGVKDMIESQLTSRGSMTSLAARGQKGWRYGDSSKGAADSSKRERLEETDEDRKSQQLRSRTLVVTDVPAVIERVASLLDQVDVIPAQVLIEARFIEVNNGVLQDIGLQFGTGKDGATSSQITPVSSSHGGRLFGIGIKQSGAGAAPAAFRPESPELNNTYPFNGGLSLLFQKLDPLQFEALLHLLEEEASLNVLSSPRILTLNNQEAAIMVGTKYPIIRTEVSGQSGSISTTIDYWQDIGIQLNVVPQICEDDNIRMVIHPAVTAQIGTASGRTLSGNSVVPFTDYPVLSTRETETQIIIKNAQTLAIGGLLKNEEQETIFKVPFLGDLPLIGRLFRRRTTNMKQLDLVIFLTATRISNEENVLASEDREIEESRKAMHDAEADLAAEVAPQMSADLRALMDLEKVRRSGDSLGEGLERLSKSERERRWQAEEELREELIRRLQTQREKQSASR